MTTPEAPTRSLALVFVLGLVALLAIAFLMTGVAAAHYTTDINGVTREVGLAERIANDPARFLLPLALAADGRRGRVWPDARAAMGARRRADGGSLDPPDRRPSAVPGGPRMGDGRLVLAAARAAGCRVPGCGPVHLARCPHGTSRSADPSLSRGSRWSRRIVGPCSRQRVRGQRCGVPRPVALESVAVAE